MSRRSNLINPDSLVSSGFIPPNLKTAVVKPENFDQATGCWN